MSAKNPKINKYLEQTEDDQWDNDFIFENTPPTATSLSASASISTAHSAVGSNSGSGKEGNRHSKKYAHGHLSTETKRRSRPKSKRTPISSIRKGAPETRVATTAAAAESPSTSVQSSSLSLVSAVSSQEPSPARPESSRSPSKRVAQLIAQLTSSNTSTNNTGTQRKVNRLPPAKGNFLSSADSVSIGTDVSKIVTTDIPLLNKSANAAFPALPPAPPPPPPLSSASSIASMGVATQFEMDSPVSKSSRKRSSRRVTYDPSVGTDLVLDTGGTSTSNHGDSSNPLSPIDSLAATRSDNEFIDDFGDESNYEEDDIPNVGFYDYDYRRSVSKSTDDAGMKELMGLLPTMSLDAPMDLDHISSSETSLHNESMTSIAVELHNEDMSQRELASSSRRSNDGDNIFTRSDSNNSLLGTKDYEDMIPWEQVRSLSYSSRRARGHSIASSRSSACSTPTSVRSDDSRIIGLEDVGGAKTPAERRKKRLMKRLSKSFGSNEFDEAATGPKRSASKKPQVKPKYKGKGSSPRGQRTLEQFSSSFDDRDRHPKFPTRQVERKRSPPAPIVPIDYADLNNSSSSRLASLLPEEPQSDRLFVDIAQQPSPSNDRFRKLRSMGDLQPDSNNEHIDLAGFDESDVEEEFRDNYHRDGSRFDDVKDARHSGSDRDEDGAEVEDVDEDDEEDEDEDEEGDWDTMIGDSQGEIPGGYSYAAMFREAEAEDEEPVIAQRESLLEFLESTANNTIFPRSGLENCSNDLLNSISGSQDPLDAPPGQQRPLPDSEESIPSESRSMLELEESMFVEAANLHLKGLLEWIEQTSATAQKIFNSSNCSETNNASTAIKSEVRLPDGDSFFMDRILQRCENDPLNPSCIYSLEVVVKWFRGMCCAYPVLAGSILPYQETAASNLSRNSFFTQVSNDANIHLNMANGSHSSSRSSWLMDGPPVDEQCTNSDAGDLFEDGNQLHGDVSARRIDRIYTQSDLILNQQCSLASASLTETHNKLMNALNSAEKRKERKGNRKKSSSPRANSANDFDVLVPEMFKLISNHISLCRLRLNMIEVKLHLYKSYDQFLYLEKLHNIVEELDDASHTWLKTLMLALPEAKNAANLKTASDKEKEGKWGFGAPAADSSSQQFGEAHARLLESTITDLHALCLVDKLLVCCAVSPISFQPLTQVPKATAPQPAQPAASTFNVASNSNDLDHPAPKDMTYRYPNEGVPARSYFGNAGGATSIEDALLNPNAKASRLHRKESHASYNVVYELTSGTQFIDLMAAIASPSVVRSRLSFAAFLYLQKLRKKELVWQQPMRYKLISVKPIRESIVTYNNSFNNDQFGLDYTDLDHDLFHLSIHDVESTIVQSFSDAFLQLDELRIMQLLLYEASVELFPSEKREVQQEGPAPFLRSAASINRRVFQFDNDNESRGGSVGGNAHTVASNSEQQEMKSLFSHVVLSLDLDQSLQDRLREMARVDKGYGGSKVFSSLDTKMFKTPYSFHGTTDRRQQRAGSNAKPPVVPKPIFDFVPSRSRHKSMSHCLRYELFSFSYQVFVRLAQWIVEMSPSAALDLYEICILILSHLGWDEKLAIQKEAVMLAIKLDRREAAILHGEGVLQHLQRQSDNITEMLYMTDLLAAQYMENAQYELAVKALLSAITALNNRHKLSRTSPTASSKGKALDSSAEVCYTTLDFERAVDPLLLKLGKTLLQYGSHDRAADAFQVLLTSLSERTDCVANDEKKVSVLSWLAESYLQMDDVETCHHIIKCIKAIRADKIHKAFGSLVIKQSSSVSAVAAAMSAASMASHGSNSNTHAFTPRRGSKAVQNILLSSSNDSDDINNELVPNNGWLSKFDALGISRTFSQRSRGKSTSSRHFSFRMIDHRGVGTASKNNLLKPTVQQSRMLAVAESRASVNRCSPRSNASSSNYDINGVAVAAQSGLGARGFRRVTSSANTTTIMHRYLVNNAESNLPKFCVTSHNTDLGLLIARVYYKSKQYVAALKSLTPTIIGVELLGGGKMGSRQAMLELAELYFLRGKIQFEAARSTSTVKYPFEVGSPQLFEAVSALSLEASRGGYGVQSKSGHGKSKDKRQYSRQHLHRSRLGGFSRASDTSSNSQCSRSSTANMYLTCRNTSVYRNPSDLLWDAMKWCRRAWELYHAAGDETSAAQAANLVARCHLLPTFTPHAFFEVPVEIASNLSSYLPELKVEREPAKRPAHDLGDWFVSSPAAAVVPSASKAAASPGTVGATAVSVSSAGIAAARSTSASQKFAADGDHAHHTAHDNNNHHHNQLQNPHFHNSYNHSSSSSKAPLSASFEPVRPRAADIVPRFASLDEVERVMQFALDINLESCLPFQLMESYLNLAELNFLQGNKLDAIAFWWETKDLFLHLFADGVLVPLLRRATLEFVAEACAILNRLVQFLWVTDRLIVNQNLFLLEMQIIMTHEAERAGRRDAVKARAVSKLLPQVLEKLLLSSTTASKEALQHFKKPLPVQQVAAVAAATKGGNSSSSSNSAGVHKAASFSSTLLSPFRKSSTPPNQLSQQQQQFTRPVSLPAPARKSQMPAIRSLKRGGVNSLNLHNAFDLFIARQGFNVHQDVRSFYNALNANMVMEKVHDFSWSQFIDYDYCALEQAPLRRLGHSTSLQGHEYALQRAFSSSFSLIGSKSASDKAASKSSSDRNSQEQQQQQSQDVDGNTYLKQLDSRVRKQSDMKYRNLPQYVLPHLLKRSELIEEIIDVPTDDEDEDDDNNDDDDELLSDDNGDGESDIDGEEEEKKRQRQRQRGVDALLQQRSSNNSRLEPVSIGRSALRSSGSNISSSSNLRSDPKAIAAAAATALGASLGGSELLPPTATSSNSLDWQQHHRQQQQQQHLHQHLPQSPSQQQQQQSRRAFDKNAPLDPFTDFAWMDESYADYSAHIRSVHSRANSRYYRNKRATAEGRARFSNLFMPEFDEAHIDFGSHSISSDGGGSGAAKSAATAAAAGTTTAQMPEIHRDYLKRVDERAETILVQRLWRNYLLVKNAHEQYKTRKPSMALLRHHVRSALCNISIYMYRLRAFSRQYQGSVLNYDELQDELCNLPVAVGADGKAYPYGSCTMDEELQQQQQQQLLLRPQFTAAALGTTVHSASSIDFDYSSAEQRATYERAALQAVLLQTRLPLAVFVIHIGDLLLVYRPHDGSKHVQLFGGAGYITFSRLFKEEEEEKERAALAAANDAARNRRIPRKFSLSRNVSSQSASTIGSRDGIAVAANRRAASGAAAFAIAAADDDDDSESVTSGLLLQQPRLRKDNSRSALPPAEDADVFWSLSQSNSWDHADTTPPLQQQQRRYFSNSNRTSPRLSPRAGGTPRDSPRASPRATPPSSARCSPSAAVVAAASAVESSSGGRESPRGSILLNSVRGASKLLTSRMRKNSKGSVATDDDGSEPDEAAVASATLLRSPNSISFKPSFQASLTAEQTNLLFDLVVNDSCDSNNNSSSGGVGGGKVQRLAVFNQMKSGILSFAVEFLLTVGRHAAEERSAQVKRSSSFNIPVTISEEAAEDLAGSSSSSSDSADERINSRSGGGKGNGGRHGGRTARQLLLKADSENLPQQFPQQQQQLPGIRSASGSPRAATASKNTTAAATDDAAADAEAAKVGSVATAVYASRMRSRHEVSGFFISADSRSQSNSPLVRGGKPPAPQEISSGNNNSSSNGGILSSSTFSSASRGAATTAATPRSQQQHALTPEVAPEYAGSAIDVTAFAATPLPTTTAASAGRMKSSSRSGSSLGLFGSLRSFFSLSKDSDCSIDGGVTTARGGRGAATAAAVAAGNSGGGINSSSRRQSKLPLEPVPLTLISSHSLAVLPWEMLLHPHLRVVRCYSLLSSVAAAYSSSHNNFSAAATAGGAQMAMSLGIASAQSCNTILAKGHIGPSMHQKAFYVAVGHDSRSLPHQLSGDLRSRDRQRRAASGVSCVSALLHSAEHITSHARCWELCNPLLISAASAKWEKHGSTAQQEQFRRIVRAYQSRVVPLPSPLLRLEPNSTSAKLNTLSKADLTIVDLNQADLNVRLDSFWQALLHPSKLKKNASTKLLTSSNSPLAQYSTTAATTSIGIGGISSSGMSVGVAGGGVSIGKERLQRFESQASLSAAAAAFPVLLLSFLDFVEVSDALAYIASKRYDAIFVFSPASIADVVAVELKNAIDRHCKPDPHADLCFRTGSSNSLSNKSASVNSSANLTTEEAHSLLQRDDGYYDFTAAAGGGDSLQRTASGGAVKSIAKLGAISEDPENSDNSNEKTAKSASANDSADVLFVTATGSGSVSDTASNSRNSSRTKTAATARKSIGSQSAQMAALMHAPDNTTAKQATRHSLSQQQRVDSARRLKWDEATGATSSEDASASASASSLSISGLTSVGSQLGARLSRSLNYASQLQLQLNIPSSPSPLTAATATATTAAQRSNNTWVYHAVMSVVYRLQEEHGLPIVVFA